MKPTQLLDHFDRISEAPDAIPRLRRFILDLAVRGKLVEQDLRDEPASELLKRIQAEKARLMKIGQIKNEDELPPVNEDELPFEVPSNWSATRLAVVAESLDYMRVPINGTEREQRIAGKDPSELFPYYGATQQQGWIDDYIFDEELVLLGEDGVPFFDDLRPKAYLISGKTWVNNHAHVFRCIMVSHPFVVHYLNTFNYAGRVAGATRGKLNKSRAVDIPIIIPPLAEQQRIVAKVGELMALCDRLEAAQTERESRRDRLAGASLNRLNHPADGPSVFQEHARFYFNHLPRLTTSPEHIQQLRQTILNLAVRGELVPQDPNDEAASQQLKRIHVDKSRLIKEGTIRRQEAVDQIRDEDIPFCVPKNWQWSRLGEVLFSSFYGPRFGADEYSTKGIPTIRTTDMTDDGRIVLRDPPKVTVPEKRLNDFKCEKGDLLVTRTGSIGIMAVFTGDYAAIPSAYLIRLRFMTGTWVDYIHLVLRSPYGQAALGLNTTKVAQPNINAKNLAAIMVPLPPLAEQQRIVAKVDELMALCDRLEAQLTTTQTESRRLLEAVLARVFTGDETWRSAPIIDQTLAVN